MYIVNNIKFDHLGSKSHDKKFNYEANLSRNCIKNNWSLILSKDTLVI